MALTFKEVRRLFQVPTRGRVRLRDYDPDWAAEEQFKDLTKDELKARAQEFLRKNAEGLGDAQERLYASDTHAVLIVLQASDAAGKDRHHQARHVRREPAGLPGLLVQKPSSEDVDHNFLWRYMKCLPERGASIFNRSYYEDVLVVRVHPELLGTLPGKRRGGRFWEGRYDDINRFERHLTRNGTLILKFFLNVSKKEQGRRFMERLDVPEKNWKFSLADLEERRHWPEYQEAFESMLQHTSTPWAPWWVLPADHKWVTRTLVAGIITKSIDKLGVKFPDVTAEQRRRLNAARRELTKQK